MSLRPNLAFLIFFSAVSFSVSAQQKLGSSLGNYAGLNSLQLNPSALHNSKSYLEIQLFGIDEFVQNNYLYISKSDYRFRNLFSAGYQWPTHTEDNGIQSVFYHYANQKDKNAFTQTRIDGPGAMLIVGHHAFALSTAFRTVVSMENIPYEIANFAYLGLDYQPQQGINYTDNGNIRASGMAWGEIGLSYSNIFYSRGFNVLSAGISVKRLLGMAGVYFNSRSLDYTVLNDSTIDIKNLDAEIGLSIPVNYNANTYMSSPLIKGGGFSVDLGMTYTRLTKNQQDLSFTSLCSQHYEDYLYRIGVALIDIGGIKFTDNADKVVIDNRSSYWSSLYSMHFTSSDQLIDTISYRFYGDTTSAWDADHFTLWLPSALSVQFDYHLRQNWYVNASLIYGFPITRGSVTRPPELSITPRYETRWFEASMPVSLYNWQLARLGLALRIYGLTIGTDKLGGFFHFSDFTGLDFYMSLKIFFDKGNCRDKFTFHCGGNSMSKIKH